MALEKNGSLEPALPLATDLVGPLASKQIREVAVHSGAGGVQSHHSRTPQVPEPGLDFLQEGFLSISESGPRCRHVLGTRTT